MAGRIGQKGLYGKSFGAPQFKGGWNTNDPMSIRGSEVAQALNCYLHDGIRIRPGSLSLDNQPFILPVKMFKTFTEVDGTDHIIALSDHKLWEVLADGSRVELIDLVSGTGNGYLSNYLDKAWVATGSTPCKIENDTSTYRIGIDAPTTGSCAVAAGGSLPDGVDYDVYVAYARKIGGLNKLYSTGNFLGTFTLGTGNNTLAITSFGNSTDPQVNNKVVFIKKTGETGTYLFHETDDNTTTTINVSAPTAIGQSSGTLYDNISKYNIDVPDFEHIYTFKNRIYGSIGNTIYYSLQSTNNVYDMERFLVDSYYELPSEVLGMKSLLGQLYVNTKMGLIRFRDGNMESSYDELSNEHFFDIDTVVEYNDKLWGLRSLTQLGVFDGERFLNYNISMNVSSEIDKIYNNYTTYKPSAFLRTINGRTQYHLLYHDNTVSGSTTHNARLVLDLTGLQFLNNGGVISPYYYWDNGASSCTSYNGLMYSVQSHASQSIIYKEILTQAIDTDIYLSNGNLDSASVTYRVDTRTEMRSLESIIYFRTLRTLSQSQGPIVITVFIGENENLYDEENVSSSFDVLIYDDGNWDEEDWGQSKVSPTKNRLGQRTKGRTYFIRITGTTDDISTYIQNVTIQGKYKVSTTT